ncbi:MAG: HsdM family class I SAM-dependent methyltransferase [Saprospiraceae bacterium]
MSLIQLEYTIKNDGFVICKDENQAKNKVELLYLKECKRLPLAPSAIFFRRFYKEDNSTIPYHSEPSVCIFNTKEYFFNTEEHKELHRALWSAGKNDIYIIQTPTRVDIINARRPAKVNSKKELTLDTSSLRLAEGLLQDFNDFRFSSHLFSSGVFWEQSDFTNVIDENSMPHLFLLNHLIIARKELHKEAKTENLSNAIIDKLLIISILVKFLEEIKDDNGRHTLKAIYRKLNIESEQFAEVIKNGKIFEVLGELAKEFNGKIFDQFSDDEKQSIQKANLKSLIQFLEANIEISTQQFFLWEQYNFKYLPAEVISSIYENFTGEGEKGVVYTPIHLVNMLVDEVMPLDKYELFKDESFKILDPACGSGVFLVAAYKRLLQWWVINNEKPIDSQTAKRILEENIYGVDVEETAVLVSIFGLTISLLDRLSPKEIWNNLKFKDLRTENVEEANFNNWIINNKENKEKYFDVILGNPPFNASSKGTITKKDFKEILNKEVPGNKLALMFLESALYFGKKVCMIIPSNVFLYNKASTNHKYRKRIFTDYTVEKIYDFTHLRRILFHKTADTPIIALTINNQPSKYQSIEHIVVKRQFQSERKMRFEIDYYDNHIVSYDKAISEKRHFVWKTNLLGGGRLFHLIYRLGLLRTLKEFINNKKKENSEWIYQSGYKIGGKTKKKKALFIENGDKIINVSEDGRYDISTNGEKTDMFESFPAEIMYQPPFIVFDQIIGNNNIPISIIEHYHKEYIYFNRDFVGIHAPKNDLNILRKIYQQVRNISPKLYQLSALVNSGSIMIILETAIRKQDIDNLPYPENKQYLKLSSQEKAIQDDVLNYYIHLGKAITKNGNGTILHQPIREQDVQLKDFGKTYCDSMNEIYGTTESEWQIGTIKQTPNFLIYQIGFGKKDGLKYQFVRENSDNIIQKLIDNDLENSGVRFKRIVRYYNHIDGYDCIFFIKPRAKRYWLNSIALRDADDTFMDLKAAGY